MSSILKKTAAALLAAVTVLSLCSCGAVDRYFNRMERDKDGVFTVDMQKGEIRFYEDDFAKVSVRDIRETKISDTERDFSFTFVVTPKTDVLIGCSDFAYELVMAGDYAKAQDGLSYSADKLGEYGKDEQSYEYTIRGIELAKGTDDLAWLESMNIDYTLNTRKMGALKEKDGMMVAEYEDSELSENSVTVGFNASGTLNGIKGSMIAEGYERTETLEESMGFTHTGITGFFTDFFNMIRKRNPGSN